ncbi:YkvA family protein [Paenibacillus sp. BC26]|uniref:YkvA family protein n=1 Tax=Paenibacillus sp. BC26 TaxID=1881032 RepID=UPI0008E36E6F|nr:YkvA family protein [Paenibacillus sp. BC26]SFT18884.1 Uncharacterized membrane protein YkvA, DUF1232 family [Paenibacillus sp. BC26]
MQMIVECSNCGRKNQVDALKVKAALCDSCKEQLVDEDAIPAAYSDEEIAAAVEAAPSGVVIEEVETDKYISRIGNHEEQVNYVNKGFWSKVKKYAAKVPFSHEAVSMYYCATDPATPTAAKVTAISALAYFILPIDVIPDFIPVAGFADDGTAVFIAYKAITIHITEEHRAKAAQFFAE